MRALRWRFALLIVWAALPSPTQAQETVVRYDWRTQSFDRLDRISPRDLLKVEILNPNTPCYAYVVSLDQVAAEEATIDPVALFTGQSFADPPPDDEGDDSPAKGVVDAALAPPDQEGRQPASRDRRTIQREAALKKIADEITSINSAIETLGKEVAATTAAGKAAKDATEAFYKRACPATNRGTPIVARDIRDAETKIDALIVKVGELAQRLQEARAIRGRIDAAVAAATVFGTTYNNPNESGPVLAEALKVLLAKSEAVLAKQEVMMRSLQGLSAEGLREDKSRLQSAVAPASITRTVQVKPNTERISVAITATGKAGVPNAAGAKHDDAFDLLVERPHRVFVSVGFIWSAIDESRFERVNRIADAADGTPVEDSTFSTYAAVDESSSIGFAPAAILNVSLFNWDDVSIYASGGVAARSVNDSLTPPDYLLGASIGVIDRVLLSALVHRGRVENLLLGSPAEVAAGPVPSTITRGSAVGTTGKWGLALTFSLRTN